MAVYSTFKKITRHTGRNKHSITSHHGLGINRHMLWNGFI